MSLPIWVKSQWPMKIGMSSIRRTQYTSLDEGHWVSVLILETILRLLNL
jgi:hypothetical protein